MAFFFVRRLFQVLVFLGCLATPGVGTAQKSGPQVYTKRTYYDYQNRQLHEEYQYTKTANQLVVKNGYYKEYTPEGVIKARANYRNNELDGVRTTYENWGNGPEPFEIDNYKNGQLHGYSALWWFNDAGKRLKARAGSYYNGKKDGPLTKWDKDGSRAVENWNRGVLDGEQVQYGANGKRLQEEYYVDGQSFSGIVEEEFSNGQVSQSISYENAIRTGPTKTWYISGKLKSQTNYKNGRSVWPTLAYLETGEPDSSTQVALGQMRSDSLNQAQVNIVASQRAFRERHRQDSVQQAVIKAKSAQQAENSTRELAKQLLTNAQKKQGALAKAVSSTSDGHAPSSILGVVDASAIRTPQKKIYIDLYNQLLAEYQAASTADDILSKARRLLAMMDLAASLYRGEQSDLNKAIRKEDDLRKVLLLTGL